MPLALAGRQRYKQLLTGLGRRAPLVLPYNMPISLNYMLVGEWMAAHDFLPSTATRIEPDHLNLSQPDHELRAFHDFMEPSAWVDQHMTRVSLPFVVGDDLVSGLLVAMVLVLASLPLLSWMARQEDDPRIRRIIGWGFFLKLMAAPAQLVVAQQFFSGIADFNIYHGVGATLATQFRHGNFSTDIGPVTGTGFISVVTGIVYTVTGVTKLGGSFVFAWLGFLGLCCFYRAFVMGFPQGDRRRYALLVFLLPSMVFWSSSIGKDAWMTLTLVIITLGGARLLTRIRGGFLIFVVGLAGAAMVRPHVALIAFVGFAAGYMLRRPQRRSPLNPVVKLGGVATLMIIGVALASSVASFFGVSSLSESTVQGQLNKNNKVSLGTTIPGAAAPNTGFSSSFDTSQARSVSHLPFTVVTVLFRPLPYEVHSIPQLLASLEGTFLLATCLVSVRRVVSSVRWARASPYVVVSLVYTAVFVYLFSSVGNLGILSRQRVQMLPFLAVLLAVPLPTPGRKPKDAAPPGATAVTG
jgi:hypothetical protein